MYLAFGEDDVVVVQGALTSRVLTAVELRNVLTVMGSGIGTMVCLEVEEVFG